MFHFPLISKGALSLESLSALNKRAAAARRAYPSRMSGAIDLILLQVLPVPSRGGCHSASLPSLSLTGLRYPSIRCPLALSF